MFYNKNDYRGTRFTLTCKLTGSVPANKSFAFISDIQPGVSGGIFQSLRANSEVKLMPDVLKFVRKKSEKGNVGLNGQDKAPARLRC